MASKSNTVHAFDFLQSPAAIENGVVALFGSERFLKRMILDRLAEQLGGGDDEFEPLTLSGETASLADMMDELSTRSLFGGGRPKLVIVDHADAFVTKHRAHLEDLADDPPSSGLLVLVVDKWPANTRIYKRIDAKGMQVRCDPPSKGKSKQPDNARIAKWLTERAKTIHQFSLPSAGASVLIDLTSCEFGRMDQELQKLALYADDKGKVDHETVVKVVGGWKAETMWEAIDAACGGDAATALKRLDHLLRSGEHPLALFGSLSWSLRRYASATEVVMRQMRGGQRPNLGAAIAEAGFRPWGGEQETAAGHLKQLTRHRAGRLHDWLLEADLALKGTHSHEDRSRLVLETLFVRMAKELNPTAAV